MVVRQIGAALLVLALASPARADADTYVPPGVKAAKVWRLSLAEALQVALHQNLGIVLERAQVAATARGVDVAKGAFEPTLIASYDHNRADSPPLTVQEGIVGQNILFVTDDWRVTLSDRLETGTLLSLDFTNGRAYSPISGTAVEPLNYRSALTATLTQPLLRGFSPDLVLPRVDVLRAKIATEHERAQLAVTAAE